jgi:Acetyltransferases
MEYEIIFVDTKEEAIIANKYLTMLIQDEKQYDRNINQKCVINNFYENMFNNETACLLLVKHKSKYIGYLYGYIVDSGNAYLEKVAQLDAMYVESKYRKSGIGKKLIEEFKNWAKNKNIKFLELKVCNNNIAALKLYEKQNFKNIKTIMMCDLEEI